MQSVAVNEPYIINSIFCYFYCITAVCISCYVITISVRSKYDMDGHYFRFEAQILKNNYVLHDVVNMSHCCYVIYRSCISYAIIYF